MTKKRANKLTSEQVFKRAGGRRRYNRERQEAASARLEEVRRLFDLYGRRRRGVRARIARELQVSRATVTRDVQLIQMMEWARENPVQAVSRLYAGAGPEAAMRLLSDLVSEATTTLW